MLLHVPMLAKKCVKGKCYIIITYDQQYAIKKHPGTAYRSRGGKRPSTLNAAVERSFSKFNTMAFYDPQKNFLWFHRISGNFSPRIPQCYSTVEHRLARYCVLAVSDEVTMALELEAVFRLRLIE